MTAEEFFIEQFNKCAWIEDENKPGNIFMVYDKHYGRAMKMNSILENKKEIEFIKTEDTFTIFYQDYKNGYLECNYDEVWSVLEDKYGLKYKEIKELIKGILNDDTKLNVLTPTFRYCFTRKPLNDDTKLNVLTPGSSAILNMKKLNVLKPFLGLI